MGGGSRVEDTDVRASGPRQPRVTQLLNPLSACRLELDINTIPEHTSRLEGDLTANVFGEPLDFAREIAEKGNIP